MVMIAFNIMIKERPHLEVMLHFPGKHLSQVLSGIFRDRLINIKHFLPNYDNLRDC